MQNDSDIGISCIFAKGSTARGCYILIFKETVVVSGTVATVANSAVEVAPNSAEHLVTGLTTGTYNILVFDVESDGSFNPSQRPAFSAVANISVNWCPQKQQVKILTFYWLWTILCT